MIDLPLLARLAAEHARALDHPIATVRVAGVEHDLDAAPLLMGVLNLSRDSTYRESVALGVDSALRRARIMVAQGAGLIDVGAEATSPRASSRPAPAGGRPPPRGRSPRRPASR